MQSGPIESRVSATGRSDADQDFADLIEQVTRELDENGSVDVEALTRIHPQHAERLQQILPAMQVLAGSRHNKGCSVEIGLSAADPPGISGRRTLGDFQIIRELGRGGMGVVYEAEQISLGRRVALKVLPFVAMLDKQQLARFKNEARAAAMLDHPNIVTIYYVGSERSVHYYSMQLVEGQSLAELIEQLMARSMEQEARSKIPILHAPNSPLPADTQPIAALSTLHAPSSMLPALNSREYCRTVARLGFQATEALDHAHQYGILHRDIKPANLLIDDTEKLWITDFGLARIEADAGLTVTGDLLGTIRYMSPEQALAKRAVVDHRTDIYSLGVTLYELLTLRPAYAGDDRQELLRQIAYEEPRPPRQINSNIPQDLATIVVKAMEKEPARRYATAHDMANDLRCFLDNKPIKAKPPTWRDQAVKWSRRHRAVMWSAGAALLVAVAVLIASIAMISGALAQTKRALGQVASERNTANAARDDARQERDAGYQNLYVAQMRLAQQNWEHGDVARMQDLLDEHLPRPGRADLRGWEWYYLRSLPAQGEELVFRGHAETSNGDGVRAVAWSPDGRQVASTAMNSKEGQCEIKIWKPDTGTEIRTLRNPDWVRTLAWSPDGQHLASTAGTGVIHIWDLNSGKRQLNIDTGSGDRLWSVSWSPDNKKLVSPGTDKSVVLWDANSGEAVQKFAAQNTEVRLTAWSPDGRSIAATGWEPGWITILDVDSGKLRQTLSSEDYSFISALAWSPDSTRIASGDLWHAAAKVWDVATGKELLSLLHSSWVGQVAFSPDGRRLATGRGNRVTVWNATTGEAERMLQGHDRRVNSIAWSPDGKHLVTGARDGLAKIWNMEHDPTILPHNDNVLPALLWSPDDRLLAYGSVNKTVVICDASTGKHVHVLEGNDGLVLDGLRWNSDGRFLACSGANGMIRVWDALSGKTLHTWTHEGEQSSGEVDQDRWVSISWHPNGWQLASASHKDDTVRIWDARSAKLIDSFETGNDLGRVEKTVGVWSPDGERLVTCGQRTGLQIWDAAGWRRLHLLQPLETGGMAWSPNGHYLALGGSSETPIEVLDTFTGRAVQTCRGLTGVVQTLVWGSDGRRLMSCGEGEALLWDILTGDQLLRLEGRGFAAWSHDQKRIAVISDHKIHIHDASAGYKLATDSSYSRYRAKQHTIRSQQLAGIGDHAKAISELELALQLAPDDPTVQISAAVFLANCADQRFRDPGRALELAKQATAATPGSVIAWQALGWALYRNGDWAASAKAMEKSMALEDGGDPFQWYFLAMANWHMGNQEQARQWYDKSVAWNKPDANQHMELMRFKQEAEAVLGLPQNDGREGMSRPAAK